MLYVPMVSLIALMVTHAVNSAVVSGDVVLYQMLCVVQTANTVVQMAILVQVVSVPDLMIRYLPLLLKTRRKIYCVQMASHNVLMVTLVVNWHLVNGDVVHYQMLYVALMGFTVVQMATLATQLPELANNQMSN